MTKTKINDTKLTDRDRAMLAHNVLFRAHSNPSDPDTVAVAWHHNAMTLRPCGGEEFYVEHLIERLNQYAARVVELEAEVEKEHGKKCDLADVLYRTVDEAAKAGIRERKAP